MKNTEQNTEQKPKKKKSKVGNIILNLILVIALGVLAYSGYNLYQIYHEYQVGEDEYDDLQSYVTENPTVAETPADSTETPKEVPQAPIAVNFEELKAVNPDIIGWVYIEAVPKISYPIVQGTDNDYYLHHTVEGTRNTSASIFMDYQNKSDFSDPNTIIYGHNMKNQSMFGLLKNLRDQSVYDTSPYFWILTPEGNYRYHIFAARSVSQTDEVYGMFAPQPEEYKAYLESVQAASDVVSNLTFTGNEKVVTLSTCTSDSTVRCVVQGVREEW